MTDINERAAIAAGWRPTKYRDWLSTDGNIYTQYPDCEHSLDAGLALLWPLVQAKGGRRYRLYQFDAGAEVSLFGDVGHLTNGDGPTPAAAFALACLQVLEEPR